jgi:hypothetical protein
MKTWRITHKDGFDCRPVSLLADANRPEYVRTDPWRAVHTARNALRHRSE